MLKYSIVWANVCEPHRLLRNAMRTSHSHFRFFFELKDFFKHLEAPIALTASKFLNVHAYTLMLIKSRHASISWYITWPSSSISLRTASTEFGRFHAGRLWTWVIYVWIRWTTCTPWSWMGLQWTEFFKFSKQNVTMQIDRWFLKKITSKAKRNCLF